MGTVKDLTGKKFNRLTVLSFAYCKNRRSWWNCVCDCGNTCIANSAQLTLSKRRSCGCLFSEVRRKDYTGLRSGDITAIKFVERKNNATFWECKCDCGNTVIVNINELARGRKIDCGCKATERRRLASCSHGLSDTRLYNIFSDMKQRCYNKRDKDYHNYGGRGISICNEWLSDFISFYNWSLEHGYKDNLTIDRIDFNGNYCPENCRWVTTKVQNNNRRSNKLVTYKNETHTVSQWSEIVGLPRKVLENRLRKGQSPEVAFFTPLREHSYKISLGNESHTIKEWAELKGLTYSALEQRLHLGWSVEKALNTPLTITSKTKKEA